MKRLYDLAYKIYENAVKEFGENSYYSCTKFIWVKFPDGRDVRLDSVVDYPETNGKD
jgi:hypothetical protein